MSHLLNKYYYTTYYIHYPGQSEQKKWHVSQTQDHAPHKYINNIYYDFWSFSTLENDLDKENLIDIAYTRPP